jgi:dCMP deaminase
MTALAWSKRSCCKRNQCGAVITNLDMDRILSFGYNGPAHGLPNDRCRNTEGTCGCLHAEINAIIRCPSREDKILFVTTSPCEQCAQAIIQANIVKVNYLALYRDLSPLNLLSRAGVKFEKHLLTDPIANLFNEIERLYPTSTSLT